MTSGTISTLLAPDGRAIVVAVLATSVLFGVVSNAVTVTLRGMTEGHFVEIMFSRVDNMVIV